jgi:hypothetical protein
MSIVEHPRSDEIEQLYERIWKLVIGEDLEVAGPAMQITLTRMIAWALGPSGSTPEKLADIHNDLNKVILKWGVGRDPRH